MRYIIVVALLLVLTGCASVGPVEITEDDNLFTIGTAFILAIAVFGIKGYIEFLFAKALERYKKKLNK